VLQHGRADLPGHHPLHYNTVARRDLLEQFPQQHRDARDTHQAQDWVVMRTRQLITLTGPNLECRVLARMEELTGADRIPVAVVDLEIDIVL
jgi:hypothetical protein